MLKNISPIDEEMEKLPIGDLFCEINEGDEEDTDIELVIKKNNNFGNPEDNDAQKRNTNFDVEKLYSKLGDVLDYVRDLASKFGAMLYDTKVEMVLVREKCCVLAEAVDGFSTKLVCVLIFYFNFQCCVLFFIV